MNSWIAKSFIVFLSLACTFKAFTSPEKKMSFSEPKLALAFETSTRYIAHIKTSKGMIVCELFPEKAPISVTNFVTLAKGGFYKGLTFHRVVADFVVQGGDPRGDGTGGPGYTLPAEIHSKHAKGALAWARLSDQVNPQRRSSGSQFYIALKELPFLDGQYTVFGQTVQGMDIVEKIQMGDKIESIEIVEIPKP
jgi:peptidyl-prolyl cis-trans isomerase B (cyclophilin B)